MEAARRARAATGREGFVERRRLMDSDDWLDGLVRERMRADAEREATP